MHLKDVDKNARTNVSIAIQYGKRARVNTDNIMQSICASISIFHASSIQVVSHDVMTAY